MQENTSGNSLYTGGVRYITADEPTTCVRCGHDEHKARGLGLLPPTRPKPGYIRCPLCSPQEVYCAAEHDPTHAEEQRRLSAEIREVFAEEGRRGIKGGGSSSAGRREKKPGEKFTVRFEQEWQGFVNGSAGGSINVKRIATATERLRLDLPRDLADELDFAAIERGERNTSSLIREAFDTLLSDADSQPVAIENGTDRRQVQVRLYADQKQMMDLASARWLVTPSDMATHVLTRFLYENPSEYSSEETK